MPTVLVTGVNGFVGRHVVRDLRAHGHAVVGLSRDATSASSIAEDLVEYICADMTAPLPLLPAVDAVIHLAGLAAVGPSFDAPAEYIATNTSMVVNLCEPLLADHSSARVLVVSSGAVYDSAQTMPIGDQGTTLPNSPYVVSKLAVEQLARYYALRGLDTLVVRPFNHIGPGQGAGFLVPDMIEQITSAKDAGVPIRVGNLQSARDYTDVRDVAAAYRTLIESQVSTPGETVNVCSGEAVTGRVIVDALIELLDARQVAVEIDPTRIRPNDPPIIRGSADRLVALGWKPSRTLDQTLADIVGGLR